MDLDEIHKIWLLVSKLHANQKYGGQHEGEQIEYINHIGSVVFELFGAIDNTENMNSDLALKCGLLHDTIEDTDFTLEAITETCGVEVANGVFALTKDKGIEGKIDSMIDSLNRIKRQPKEVWAVKMADRICNLQAPPYYWDKEKKLFYIKEAKLILHELKEGNDYLARRLASKIEAYSKFVN